MQRVGILIVFLYLLQIALTSRLPKHSVHSTHSAHSRHSTHSVHSRHSTHSAVHSVHSAVHSIPLPPEPETFWITQPLDHDDPQKGSFEEVTT